MVLKKNLKTRNLFVKRFLDFQKLLIINVNVKIGIDGTTPPGNPGLSKI